MGMRLYLRAAGTRQVEQLQHDSDAAAAFLFGDAEDSEEVEGLVDLDKAWHAIHFLLTGRAGGGSWPEGFLLEGGKEIKGTETGYGPIRALTSEQTGQVFRFLSALPSVKLHTRFDPRALDRANIYPRIWIRDGEEGWEYIAAYYEILRRTFADAAAAGQGMVLCIC